jgi:branched-chain amino acid transport system substrate-binding protein
MKFQLSLLIMLSVGLSSCVTSSEYSTPLSTPKQDAVSASTQETNLYKSAEQALPNNPDLALSKLNNLALKPTNSMVYFEAMILMGKILEQQHRYDEALKAYDRVITSNFNHPKRVFAFYRTAVLYKNKGNLEKAVYYSKAGLSQPTISNQDKLIFYQFAYPLFVSKDDHLTALTGMDFIYKNTNDKVLRKDIREISKNLIQIRLNRQQLQTIINNPEMVEYHGDAYAKLGEIYFYAGDTAAATTQFDNALNLLPSGQLRQRIAEMNKYSSVYQNVNKNTIGVIVPLSGDKKSIGENILRGLKIGMESGYGNYKLVIKDSQSDPAIAAQMTDELIRQNGIFGIIGGVTTATADSIVGVASRFGVPTLVLTPKQGIVESYDFTFQNALTLKYAAFKTAESVIQNSKFNKIAVLKPDDNFGNAYADAFIQAITNSGKEVVAVRSYVFTDKGSLNNAIKGIVHLDPNGDRKDEYEQKLKEWKKENKNARRLNAPGTEELLKPIIDFDAIFIADSAKPAALVAASLPYFDIDNFPLIGTHLWNSDELIKRAPEQLEGAIFVDSLPPAGQWPNNFCTRSIATSLGGKEPNMFSVLGFDSAKIFKAALNSSPSNRVILKEKLENLGSVDGCLGKLTLDQSRVVGLPIFNLVVKDKKIVINEGSL